jgi:hypothetical protein
LITTGRSADDTISVNLVAIRLGAATSLLTDALINARSTGHEKLSVCRFETPGVDRWSHRRYPAARLTLPKR